VNYVNFYKNYVTPFGVVFPILLRLANYNRFWNWIWEYT